MTSPSVPFPSLLGPSSAALHQSQTSQPSSLDTYLTMSNETNSKLALDSYVQAARRGEYKIAHIKHEDDEMHVR